MKELKLLKRLWLISMERAERYQRTEWKGLGMPNYYHWTGKAETYRMVFSALNKRHGCVE